MRIAKILAYAIAGVVALFALLLIGVWLFVDPNDYKADIERVVEQQTHRRLTLQGDLKLSVFPWLALQMGPAQLGERAGFGDEPFVAIKEARLSVRLLPLLKGQVQVGSVRLIEPRIRLLTDRQGRRNWADLAGEDNRAPTKSSDGGVAATDVNLGGVEIRNGALTLEDRQQRTRRAIRDFSLTTGAVASGKPFDLQLSLVLEQDRQTPTPVQLSAKVTADFERAVHRLDDFRLDLQWHGEGLPKDGTPLALRVKALTVDMKKQSFGMQGLEVAAGRAKLSGDAEGKSIFDAPRLQGRLALAPLAVREALRDFGVTPPKTRDEQALKQAAFEAAFEATSSSLALSKMRMTLDDTTLSGNLAIADFKTQALRFDLNIDRIDFDRYLPPPDKQSEKKSADSAPTPIPVDAVRALNARGDLRVGEAKFGGLRLSKLHVGVNARDGDVKLQPTDATLYGGQYRGALGLNAVKTPRLTVESHASNIDFASLFKDMFDSKRVSGRGDANVNVTAVGADTAAMMQALNGALDFRVLNGAFEGTDLWYEIRRARALLNREAPPARTEAERTPFTECKGTGVFANGVLTNNDLTASMQFLKVTGQGAVDLPKNAIDYRLMTTVLRIPNDSEQANADLVDAQIPVRVTGSLSDPKVRPDVGGMVKAAVKKKAEEKLRDTVQKKLRGIFGGQQ